MTQIYFDKYDPRSEDVDIIINDDRSTYTARVSLKTIRYALKQDLGLEVGE